MTKTDKGVAPILAVDQWRNNAEMIAGVADCGYLDRNWSTMDVTYGKGTFWKVFMPRRLIAHDRYTLDGVDFRDLPHRRNSVEVVVFDPPYKLNGTPMLHEMDARYGTEEAMPIAVRHEMICDGLTECIRVARRYVLLKCQDQVASGKVHWQTRIFADHGEECGARLVDAFILVGAGRQQPEGRSQVHARRNYSTLLVFGV